MSQLLLLIHCQFKADMKNNAIIIKNHIDILHAVKGRVFHVTSEENMELIIQSGNLIPNSDLAFPSIFGRIPNGYFRKRGCVSFFDYRIYGTPQWEEHAYKCFPTQNLRKGDKMCFLFLHEKNYKHLISWASWKNEKAWCDRVVPWVEVGYKGEIPLDCISELLTVEFI